jgi:uncharacterized protein YcfL
MNFKALFFNRKTAVIVFVGLVLALTAAAGCLSKAKKVKKENQLDTETVVMKDMAVTSNVALKKEWSEVVNGMLKAHIILRNERNTPVKLEIKAIFKDGHGVPLKTTTFTWHPVHIESNEDYHFSQLCPVKGAESYQFIIKTAGK